ncbi:septal ring lytic transglycosylase RlpA family protein [Salinisphaera hydrothermalis]|nr:septal ring lytic transglycosylase RlpA family protein [Salinisphaera hydrothermalis]
MPRLMTRRSNPSAMVAALMLAIALGGCASTRIGPGAGVYQRGEAGYYAARFDGRTTASGETYNPHALTAAHRSLPMGSWVRVVNLDNHRHVTVRINDRGPFVHGRVIDLSAAAAKRLKMRRQGVVPVTLQILSEPH